MTSEDRTLGHVLICPIHGLAYGDKPGTTARMCGQCNRDRAKVGMKRRYGTITREEEAQWRAEFTEARRAAREQEREAAKLVKQLTDDLTQ
jgi:hypothetical protein